VFCAFRIGSRVRHTQTGLRRRYKLVGNSSGTRRRAICRGTEGGEEEIVGGIEK
jgi:hypothetical protein